MAATRNSYIHFTWTLESIDRLRKLWAEGLTISAIAKDIGTTAGSVSGKRLRIGLPGRPDPLKNQSLYHPKKPVKLSARALRKLHPTLPTPPKYIPEPVSINPFMLSMAELTNSTCRWPIGEPCRPGFGFCGHTTEHTDNGFRTYCDHHRGIARRKDMPVPAARVTQPEYGKPSVHEFFSKLNYDAF